MDCCAAQSPETKLRTHNAERRSKRQESDIWGYRPGSLRLADSCKSTTRRQGFTSVNAAPTERTHTPREQPIATMPNGFGEQSTPQFAPVSAPALCQISGCDKMLVSARARFGTCCLAGRAARTLSCRPPRLPAAFASEAHEPAEL